MLNVTNNNHWSSVKPASLEEMDISVFLSLKPVFCQRSISSRIKSVSILLRDKAFPTHMEVAVAEYPNGNRVVINGNTRAEIWRREEAPKPSRIIANIYKVEDDDEARDLYYTFDSQKSVETTKHKLQGVYRALGLSFNSSKIQGGSISKALEYASLNNPEIESPKNGWETVPYFMSELKALDEVGVDTKFDASIISTCLMLLKFYGVNNARLLKGIRYIKSGHNDGNNDHGKCPIGYIQSEWEAHKVLGKKGTNAIDMPRQIDFLLHCFEKFMNKERIKRYDGSIRSGGRRKDAWENFWNGDIISII